MTKSRHDDFQLELLRGSTADLDTVPLLFVHGAWHGAWCWEPFLDFLKRTAIAGMRRACEDMVPVRTIKVLKLPG